jgi:hypothetical protein
MILKFAQKSFNSHTLKSNDDLSKDKTCRFKGTQQAYAAGARGSFEYTVACDIPTGSYVRAYALDASVTQVAYGQTGPTAVFDVADITGIHASIEVAAGVFSAFSVATLAFFVVVENRKKREVGGGRAQRYVSSPRGQF